MRKPPWASIFQFSKTCTNYDTIRVSVTLAQPKMAVGGGGLIDFCIMYMKLLWHLMSPYLEKKSAILKAKRENL